MPTRLGWGRACSSWIEIVVGIISLFLVIWFFIELLRGRMSFRRLRSSGWL